MQQNTQENNYNIDEISLKEVINQLIASKKLIIIIALLSTILAYFYSSSKPPTFTSTALVEIGHYNLKDSAVSIPNDNNRKLIESLDNSIESAGKLVKNLNIFFTHKEQDRIHSDSLSFSIIEDRLIKVRTTSSSEEIGINSLNEITSFILNRHEDVVAAFTQRNLNLINTEIEQLNSEIIFNNRLLKIASKIDIQKRIITINQLLLNIDKKINAVNVVITEDTANLRLLESDPQLLKERAATGPTLSQVIYLYRISIIELESEKVNLENELLILQSDLVKINSSLDGNSKDDVYSNSEFLLSNYMTDKKTYTEITAKTFKLLQEKIIQEKNLQSLSTHTPSNTALVNEITSYQNSPQIIKFLLQGFLLGMILGIFLALIIAKFKSYKEENAITL